MTRRNCLGDYTPSRGGTCPGALLPYAGRSRPTQTPEHDFMSATVPETPQRPGLKQAVTGLVPPKTAEAHLRTAWPSVTDASPGIARFGRSLMKTIVLAPIAWLFVLFPLYVK